MRKRGRFPQVMAGMALILLGGVLLNTASAVGLMWLTIGLLLIISA